MDDQVARFHVTLDQAVRGRTHDGALVFTAILRLANLAVLLPVQFYRSACFANALFEVLADAICSHHGRRQTEICFLAKVILAKARGAVEIVLRVSLEVAQQCGSLCIAHAARIFQATGEFVDLCFLHDDYLSVSTAVE
ncbi:hypothetical protein D3C85_1283140 [compost metagenome]